MKFMTEDMLIKGAEEGENASSDSLSLVFTSFMWSIANLFTESSQGASFASHSRENSL